ncbi:MAG: HD domain-containing phosphohydrolase [Desulfatiglans sp.]|jgi:PAS domain S-box-containing protein/putative nucleotidyltransferase with HDIG domain|nr:response regulator [Thermodesulfobacteriota bacterium]MEE4351669.1 HD domain-containing phosphohydrolase [Desulfatiglans sp.]
MARVLIVDDEKPIRDLIGEILELSNHECTLAADALGARQLLKQQEFDLVLSDINMPGESGLDFIKYALNAYPEMGAIMVTALDDPMIAENAINIGVYDYLVKPFDKNAVLISVANALLRLKLENDNRQYRERLENMVAVRTAALEESEARFRAIFEAAEHVSFIMIGHGENEGTILEFSPGAERTLGYDRQEVMGQPVSMLQLPEEITKAYDFSGPFVQKEWGFTRESILIHKSGERLPALFTTYPISNAQGFATASLVVCIDISERKKTEKELESSMLQIKMALEGSIQAIARTVETRDPYTAGHQQRVADLATAIAREMKLTEETVTGIRMAGVIHDLGKVAIPTGILNKPGQISQIEFELIKTHSQVGYDILESIEFPWPIAQIVLQHHERIDGSGYPFGLSDDEILLEAKILGVADVVEAVSSHRPYRPALGIDKALEEIVRNRGRLYNPEVVDACLRLFKEKGFRLD